MSPGPPAESASPRRGIVLGAGGLLGAAWMIARLRALELARGFDSRDADVIIGSSAGSVLAAMIASGVSVQELLDHQRGTAAVDNPLSRAGFDYDSSVGGALPQRPPLRLGSVPLLREYLRHPRQLGALTGLAAALPPGRGSLAQLRSAVMEATAGVDGSWPSRPQLRVVALDYTTGRRVVFGSAEAPEASVVDAVIASCSIPGWFAPAMIDNHAYVDAGFRQATSADLAAGEGLDEVIVLSALASLSGDTRRRGGFSRLERRWRAHLTKILHREVAALDDEPCAVTVLTPTIEERRAMGGNLMDFRRRVDVLEVALATGVASDRPPTTAVG